MLQLKFLRASWSHFSVSGREETKIVLQFLICLIMVRPEYPKNAMKRHIMTIKPCFVKITQQAQPKVFCGCLICIVSDAKNYQVSSRPRQQEQSVTLLEVLFLCFALFALLSFGFVDSDLQHHVDDEQRKHFTLEMY